LAAPSRRLLAVLVGLTVALPPIPNAQASSSPPPGALPDLSNLTPEARANLHVTRHLADFGAKCDGTTDDATAFSAATAWLATGVHREIRLPAAACATSQTVTVGDGRQQNTVLAAPLNGTGTTATVASCSGIQNGDNLLIVRDDGSTYSGSVSSCSSTTLTLSAAYSGADASSGRPVYTGKPSTYHGGGFVGYGSGYTNGELGSAGAVSKIKYIGAAAPTTTLTATANANALILTVASTADMSLGAPLGIALDNGRVWWTSIDYIASATSVAIMNEIPSTATGGNTVTIAANPVAKIAGPIVGVRFEGIQLDANNLAAIGLDVQHSIGGKYRGPRGVQAFNYTGVGFFLHSTRAYLGTLVGTGDNDFEIYAQKPQNATTIGCWILGGAGDGGTGFNVAFSRNRFHGGDCKMGGNDITAAGIRWEFADNNTWLLPYASVNGANTAGAGLYRQPSHYRTGFPGGNTWIGASFASTGVTDGSDSGGAVVGADFYEKYNTESAAFPSASAYGSDDVGGIFGNALKLGNSTVTGAWQSYSPTLSCGSGSLGTGNSASGRYLRIGKTVIFEAAVTIGAAGAGTCAVSIRATLPVTAASNQAQHVVGRDNTTGNMVIGSITSGGSVVVMSTYNGGCPCANNGTPTVTGVYESQ
jgi:hypothetical protein